jgi:hypothetical protein
MQSKEERKEYEKQYRAEHKEKIKKQIKEWQEINKEKIRKKRLKYLSNNKEHVILKTKEYRNKNKEKIKLKSKKYCDNNKEKINLKTKEYRMNNKEKSKTYILKRRYNITLEEYNKLFNKQNGKCAICGKHQSELKKILSVDHNHETGKIRGLLCYNCNNGLGCFKDNKNILKSAENYLNEND